MKNATRYVVAAIVLAMTSWACASEPAVPTPDAAQQNAPIVCQVRSLGFSDCMARHAESMVKQPTDRATHMFQFQVRDSQGAERVVTVLATATTTRAQAAAMAGVDNDVAH